MPDLVNNLCGYGMLPGPLGSLPLQITTDLSGMPISAGNPNSEAGLPLAELGGDKNPGNCFADELPRSDTSKLSRSQAGLSYLPLGHIIQHFDAAQNLLERKSCTCTLILFYFQLV